MISFGVKDNFDALQKQFDKSMGSQVPFATSLGLNRTAELAMKALGAAMRFSFDRPTPYTLNSLFFKRSTKTDLSVIVGSKDPKQNFRAETFLNPGASAGSKIPASAYLRPEIEGGKRNLKSTEKLVGENFVPGPDVKLDQYGNVPSAIIRVIRQMLVSKQDTMRAGNLTYFVIRPGQGSRLKPGVYARSSTVKISGKRGNKQAELSRGDLRCIILFKQSVSYQPRYDLEGVVNRVFAAELDRQFAAAMDYALSTAKVKIPVT